MRYPVDENLAHINEEFCGHLIFSGLKMKFVNMERALKLIWPENSVKCKKNSDHKSN